MTVKAVSGGAAAPSSNAALEFASVANAGGTEAASKTNRKEGPNTKQLRIVLKDMIDLRNDMNNAPALSEQERNRIRQILTPSIEAARKSLNTPNVSEKERGKTLDNARGSLAHAYQILFKTPD